MMHPRRFDDAKCYDANITYEDARSCDRVRLVRNLLMFFFQEHTYNKAFNEDTFYLQRTDTQTKGNIVISNK